MSGLVRKRLGWLVLGLGLLGLAACKKTGEHVYLGSQDMYICATTEDLRNAARAVSTLSYVDAIRHLEVMGSNRLCYLNDSGMTASTNTIADEWTADDGTVFRIIQFTRSAHDPLNGNGEIIYGLIYNQNGAVKVGWQDYVSNAVQNRTLNGIFEFLNN